MSFQPREVFQSSPHTKTERQSGLTTAQADEDLSVFSSRKKLGMNSGASAFSEEWERMRGGLDEVEELLKGGVCK